MIIIADHGNIDIMRQTDGSPHTAHTLALVPCILVSPENSPHRHASVRDGSLADIAPTILDLMGIAQPDAMTGKSLVR
jgi:2,3-bisphosphoglycerate-independent phosphoglycerate mutase